MSIILPIIIVFGIILNQFYLHPILLNSTGVIVLIEYWLLITILIDVPFTIYVYNAMDNKKIAIKVLVSIFLVKLFGLLQTLYFGIGTDRGWNIEATSTIESNTDILCTLILILLNIYLIINYFHQLSTKNDKE